MLTRTNDTTTRARRAGWLATVAGAWLAVASSGAQAQCGNEVEHRHLAAGPEVPRLTTPEGAGILGTPFSVRVTHALPNTLGVVLYSGVETSVFNPATQAINYIGSPFFLRLFATNAEGESPLLLRSASVPEVLCGLTIVYQAAIVDPSAPAELAVTNAVRARFGDRTAPLIGPTLSLTGAGLVVRPEYLDVFDIDGDGLRDLVGFGSTSGLDATLSIHSGLPGGGFAPQVSSGASGSWSPSEPTIADIDGNGRLEVVFASLSSDTLVVLQLDDSAMVSSAVFLGGLGLDLVDVAVADLDLDGMLDVVGAGPTSDGWLLRGTGGGLFAPAEAIPVGAAQSDVELADLDEDGQLDLLAVLPSQNALAVLPGFGGGAFGAATNFATDAGPSSLLVQDLDDDGDLDVAVARTQPGLSVLLGDGVGALALSTSVPLPYEARSLHTMDRDQDGFAELVVFHGDDAAFSWFPDDDAGGLLDPRIYGVDGSAAAVLDFGLDGLEDVVGVSSYTTVARGLSSLEFFSYQMIPTSSTSDSLAVADLDGDGFDDVVGLMITVPEIVVVKGSPEGPRLFGTTPTADPSVGLSLGDVDADGELDVVVGSGTELHTYLGQGDGTFGSAIVSAVGHTSRVTALGQFDDDGVLDVVYADIMGPVHVSFGNGDGTFGSTTSIPLASSVFTVGDLDGDGLDDIAIRDDLTIVAPYYSNGDGTFTRAHEVDLGQTFGELVVLDVDADGFQDLVLVAKRDVDVLRGDGTGGFLAPVHTNLFQMDREPTFLDVDQDGLIDMLARRQGELRVYRGDGDGSFSGLADKIFPSSGPPTIDVTVDTGAGDFDGDGLPDAVHTAVGQFHFYRSLIGE